MTTASETGAPFVGYCQLANGAVGPTAFTFKVAGAAFVISGNERFVITNIEMTTNDSSAETITIDDGAGTVLFKGYIGNTVLEFEEEIPPGACVCLRGFTPQATATAVTLGKTFEIFLKGFVSN